MEVESSFLFELRMDINMGFSGKALHRCKACCRACLHNTRNYSCPFPQCSGMSPPGHLCFPQLWPKDTYTTMEMASLWNLTFESWAVRMGVAESPLLLLFGGADFCVCSKPLHRVAFSGMKLSGGTFPAQLIIVASIIVKTIPFTPFISVKPFL